MTVGEAITNFGEWLWSLKLETLAMLAGLLLLTLLALWLALTSLFRIWLSLSASGAPEWGALGDFLAGAGSAAFIIWLAVKLV